MRRIRPPFFYLFLITILLISSCAGSPEHDEARSEPPLEQVPEDDPAEVIPEDSASPEADDERDATVDTVMVAEEEPTVGTPEVVRDTVPADGVKPSAKQTAKDTAKKPRPTIYTDKDGRPDSSDMPESGEPDPVEPESEEPVETVPSDATDPIPEEPQVPETEDTPVREADGALFNPLLVEDVPYDDAEEAGETGISEPEAPGPQVTDPEVTDPEITIELIDEESPAPYEPPAADIPETAAHPVEDDLVTPEVQAGEPSRWLEGPGEFSVLLEGQGWVFRSDLSTPGSWRFLSRDIDGEVTRFTFRFDEPGKWKLVFERQDLGSGGSERAVRNVSVGESDGPVVENGPESRTNGASIPGDMPDDPSERDEAAIAALESGRSGEAISYWEKDASRDNQAGRDAREAIIREAVRTGSTAQLVTWLPRYIEDGADRDLLVNALDVLDAGMGYDDSVEIVIDELVRDNHDPRQPEWLYRLARRLEKPGDGRDLDRAAVLYNRVIEGWPYSEWRDLSEERLSWLRRHYFRVQ